MKKTKLAMVCAVFAAALTTAHAQTLTIKNTLGADSDSIGDYDLYSHSRQNNISGSTDTADTFAIGDIVQLDFVSATVDSRIRLGLLYQNADSSEPALTVLPTGYIHWSPVDAFGIVAGNSFYKHFAIPSAYLAADGTTTKYGRLLTGTASSDYYLGSTSFALPLNEFSGGVTSSLAFGDYENIYLNMAAGATVYTDYGSSTGVSVDFGINAGVTDAFDMGFTAHNVTSGYRKFGAFVGLMGVPNLVLNGAFYYNFTDSDYLAEACVERSDDEGNDVYKFKKQTTKYALGFTGGYEFEGSGLGLYADFITGLTNEYIGEIKYYDSDGNLTETEVTTIIRGATCVKYKNGKKKRTDEYIHEAIPFYTQVRIDYDVNKNFNAALNFKVRSTWNALSQTWITVYPRISIKLPYRAGTVGAGLRLDANLTRYSGISGISIPLTYTYKFKKSF